MTVFPFTLWGFCEDSKKDIKKSGSEFNPSYNSTYHGHIGSSRVNQNIEPKAFKKKKGEVVLSCRNKRMLSAHEKLLWIFSTTTTIWTSYYKYPIENKLDNFWTSWHFQHLLVLIQFSMLELYWNHYELFTAKIESQVTNCPYGYQTFSFYNWKLYFFLTFPFFGSKNSVFFNVWFGPKWPCILGLSEASWTI